MEIRLLGPVEVLDDGGDDVPLASARQRLLLAGLAARAGEVVTTDALIELLWAGGLPDDPPGALQSQVSRLRRRLGPAAPIATTAGGYRLADPEIVDAVRFRRLVAQARGEAKGDLAVLEEALALWRGRPMADLDAPPLDAAIAALEDGYAQAAERRVVALLGLGRFGEAAAAAGELAAALPFRERPVALHLEALAKAGRHAEGLRVYEAFRRSLAEELGLDPSAELALLQRQMLDAGAERGPTALPPLPMTSLVGRERALASVIEHLERSRLVTLTGAGGVGKTRLALHVAHALAPSYADGVWFCDLAALPPRSSVEAFVASVLGVEARAGERVRDRIVAFLRPRRALVVLDNCEHVVEDVAPLVTALIDATPSATVLATSRERLRTPGEQRVPVEPLPVPGAAETITLAVQLFCERARWADPSFELMPVEAEVAELCRVLGGLPLAIEVAAARTAARAPADILADLRSHGGELQGERERTPRHRSLHAVVAWSCDLLDAPHRDVFERMAVFARGWSLDAASAVADGESSGGLVTDALDELAERSLATVTTTGLDTRWTMLEPVRSFAESRLRRRGREGEVRDRHAAFFVALAEVASSALVGPEERSWADRLAEELGNLRAAHRWLVDNDRPAESLRLASASYPWVFAGAPAEVSAWAAEAVARFDDPQDPSLVGALATAAVGAWRRGDADEAIRLASRGVELGGDHAPATRRALDALGDASMIAGQYDRALSAYRAAIPLAEVVGDVVTMTNDLGSVALAHAYRGETEEAIGLADALWHKMASVPNPSATGWAHYFAGEVRLESRPGEALPMLRRAVAEAERAGNRFLLGVALVSLVSLEARIDDGAATLGRYAQLITHWQQTGAWTQLWITIRSLIDALERRDYIEQAAVLYGALTASPTASLLAGADAARLAEVLDHLIAALGERKFAALRAEGAAMGDDAVLSYVLGVLAEAAPLP